MRRGILQSLALKSIVLLNAMLICVLSTVALINIREDKKAILSNSEQVCRRLASTILTALENPMLAGNQDLIQQQFNSYRQLEGITGVYLLDHQGVIRRSTDLELIDKPDSSVHVRRALQGEKNFGIETIPHKNQAVFTKAIPIENRQECYLCHGREQKVLGVLRVSLDWAPTLAQVRFFIRQNLAVAAASISIIGVLSLIFLFKGIIAPIKMLENGLQQAAQGNLAHKVNIKRSDEIGALAAMFNKMTGELSLLIAREQDRTKKLERLNKELVEEKNKAQNYLDIAGVILIVLDRDGRVERINKKGREVLESSECEIIGKDWIDNFIPQAARETAHEAFQDIIAGKVFLREEAENGIMTKRGEEKTILWHNALLKNEQGEIVGTLSSGEDITVEKKINEQLQKKMEEFERFNKFVVGREIKMRELKEKISKLEQNPGVNK
ncbi:MAG: PAS domain-containing protein [Candidatus Omnitrophica bacterium]|nr:PAS domain-containing protein [Candidatus Omnitrophota bacterium]